MAFRNSLLALILISLLTACSKSQITPTTPPEVWRSIPEESDLPRYDLKFVGAAIAELSRVGAEPNSQAIQRGEIVELDDILFIELERTEAEYRKTLVLAAVTPDEKRYYSGEMFLYDSAGNIFNGIPMLFDSASSDQDCTALSSC